MAKSLTSRATGKHAEIIGIEQVHDVLNKLPRDLNKKVLTQSIRGVSKYIQEAAKWNVLPHSKRVSKQIKTFSVKRSPRPAVFVGWNKRQANRDYRAANTEAEKKWAIMGAWWLEYGTRGVSRRGKKVRQIQPVGWFRRAVDTKIGITERNFKKILAAKINGLLDKYITKHGW